MTRKTGFLTTLLLLAPVVALAQGEDVTTDLPIQRPVLRPSAGAGVGSPLLNANCPQATCDTVWVGHSSSGPGGAFLGIGAQIDTLAVANAIERQAVGEILAHAILPSAMAESPASCSRRHHSRVASMPLAAAPPSGAESR